MALSFTRPDPASPASVSAAQFPVSRRGYDQAEVRDFLRMVAAEQARLQERERSLERELKALQAVKSSPITAMDEETATRMLGEEAARVLQTAREGAAQIRTRAEEGSARLLREATDEAQRMREEAEIEAARRRQDAAADSESELQMAKQQGRDMVNEARAYRERVLSELARRRELARQQIEQLIHGRDRLLQAFERSRIAAVEVMAELTPLGEPDEYVNLSPTTGPVPVMLPAPPRIPAAEMVAPYLVADPDPDPDEAEAVEPAPETSAPETRIVETRVEIVSDATMAIDRVVELAPEHAAALAGASQPVVDSTTDDEVTTPEYTVEHHLATPDEPVASDELVASDHGHEGTDNVVSLPEVVVDEDTDESLAADEARAPAEVVSLFAGELNSPPDPDPEPGSAGVVSGATVGDLFARLRAARADVVVAKAIENVAAAEAVAGANSEAESVPGLEFVEPADAADVVDGPSPDEVVVPIILSAARRLKRVLADEQNEVLDTLRRKDPVRALDTLLPWEADHSGRYALAVAPDLVNAATAGAAGSEHGSNPAIIRPALDAVTNEIVAPLRDRLIRCIDRADGDNVELGNQVRTLYREWKTQRIDEHVEDIVRLAYDRGALTVTSR